MKKTLLTLLISALSFGAFAQSISGALEIFTVAGTDTYTVPAVLPATYTTNERFILKFTNANTGAATVNRNGLGAKALTKYASTALSAGDIAAGQSYIVRYDGTRYVIVGTPGPTSGQTVLVTGTKAITISGLTTSSKAFVQLVAPTGASLTVDMQAVCTTNTLTITALIAAKSINTADGSTVNYFVIY